MRLPPAPGERCATRWGAARDGIRIGLSLARFARPVRSTRSPVMTGRGLGRRLLVRDIPLADLSAAAQRAGCTLNDAYLAALLLALRDYHTRHGVEVPALRTTMPISVRSADDDIGGNHITLARFDLPTDIDDPIELMRAVHRVVDRWRREPAIGWSEALAAMFNRLPNAVLADMLAHVDFVASNVPGSPVPLHLAGAEIRRLYAFAPTLGAAFNAALVSHVDTCHIGIDLDTTAVSDPDTFAAGLDAGLHMLLAAPATARE